MLLARRDDEVVGLLDLVAGDAQSEAAAHCVARDLRLTGLEVADELVEAGAELDLVVPEPLEVLDRDVVTDREEVVKIYERAFTADVYLSSANAISEDGVIVNIDGNGNRVAAITWGPKKVIFIIGLNKVAQTVEAALARARSTASPINAARFDIKTPCQTDGVCHNCNSPESICNYVHFLRNSPHGKHVVVLVGEDWGY